MNVSIDGGKPMNMAETIAYLIERIAKLELRLNTVRESNCGTMVITAPEPESELPQ